MPTIAKTVETDENFAKVKGRKRLTDRESALLNAAFVVAESELSKLRVRHERKTGDHRVEQERTKTAAITTLALTKIEGVGKFFVTPYGEHFRNLLPHHDRPVIEAEVIEEKTNDPIEQKNVDEQPKAQIKAVDDHGKVAESLPGWSKPIVLFIEQTFAKMSPLSTALWFMIIVAGAIGFGLAQKSYLDSNYEHVSEKNIRLEKKIETLSNKVSENARLSAENSQNTNIIASLKSDNEKLSGTVLQLQEEAKKQNSSFQEKLLTMQSVQQKNIAKYQNNVDLATKNQISALSESKLRLTSESQTQKLLIGDLKLKVSELESKAKESGSLLSKQERTIRELNNTASQQQNQLRTLEEVRSQKNSLVAFTNSVLELVNEVLYKARWSRTKPYERREDFTKGFVRLRSTSKETLDELGIRKSM